jgi:hypothetical protein
VGKVWAIAWHSLRLAIRSRLVLALLALLGAAVFVLPLAVRGDGTLRGEAQVLITYSLGLAWVLLSMVSLWAGCAAIAGDIAGRQAQVVLSAPVSRTQVWLGKWLGLLLLNAGLLTAAGLAVGLVFQTRLQGGDWTDAERAELRRDVLRAHHVVHPQPVDVQAAVESRLAAEPAASGTPLPARRRELALQEETRRRSAGPGEWVEWRFDLPAALRPEGGLRLRYRFSSSRPGSPPVTGRWTVGVPGEPVRAQLDLHEAPGALRTLELPADRLGGERTLVIRFINREESDARVFFDPREGARALLPATGFAVNLGLALLVLLAHLGLLAAIGVTAGAMFSLPVASVVAVFALVMQQLSRFIGAVASGDRFWQPSDPGPWTAALLFLANQVFAVFNRLLQPLRFDNPLERVSLGHLVPPGEVLALWLTHVLLYGGVVAWLGMASFHRREVALPE